MTLASKEKKAIAALRRLAVRWPSTLMVVHSGSFGSALLIKQIDPNEDHRDIIELETIAIIWGFNADSSA